MSVVSMQILQEQQALLLEDSPAYLAVLSQDDNASFLTAAADAHQEQLQTGRGGSNDSSAFWRTADTASGAAAGMQPSRYAQGPKQQQSSVLKGVSGHCTVYLHHVHCHCCQDSCSASPGEDQGMRSRGGGPVLTAESGRKSFWVKLGLV